MEGQGLPSRQGCRLEGGLAGSRPTAPAVACNSRAPPRRPPKRGLQRSNRRQAARSDRRRADRRPADPDGRKNRARSCAAASNVDRYPPAGPAFAQCPFTRSRKCSRSSLNWGSCKNEKWLTPGCSNRPVGSSAMNSVFSRLIASSVAVDDPDRHPDRGEPLGCPVRLRRPHPAIWSRNALYSPGERADFDREPGSVVARASRDTDQPAVHGPARQQRASVDRDPRRAAGLEADAVDAVRSGTMTVAPFHPDARVVAFFEAVSLRPSRSPPGSHSSIHWPVSPRKAIRGAS